LNPGEEHENGGSLPAPGQFEFVPGRGAIRREIRDLFETVVSGDNGLLFDEPPAAPEPAASSVEQPSLPPTEVFTRSPGQARSPAAVSVVDPTIDLVPDIVAGFGNEPAGAPVLCTKAAAALIQLALGNFGSFGGPPSFIEQYLFGDLVISTQVEQPSLPPTEQFNPEFRARREAELKKELKSSM
jgi:hypothetical protein